MELRKKINLETINNEINQSDQNFGINRPLFILFVLIFFIGCSRTIPAPSEQQRDIYRKEIAPIIVWLDVEYKNNGIYPPKLRPELQSKLEGLDAPAKYDTYDNGKSYDICVGDYDRYEWAYYYVSNGKKWVFDM